KGVESWPISISWRRDRQLESVRVTQPEHARSPGHVGRLRLQIASMIFDPFSNFVDVLVSRDLQGETLTLDPVPAPGSVVLIDQQPHVPGPERHRPQLSFALIVLVDGEAHHIAVPGQTLLKVFHCQRGREGSRTKRLRLGTRRGTR